MGCLGFAVWDETAQQRLLHHPIAGRSLAHPVGVNILVVSRQLDHSVISRRSTHKTALHDPLFSPMNTNVIISLYSDHAGSYVLSTALMTFESLHGELAVAFRGQQAQDMSMIAVDALASHVLTQFLHYTHGNKAKRSNGSQSVSPCESPRRT